MLPNYVDFILDVCKLLLNILYFRDFLFKIFGNTIQYFVSQEPGIISYDTEVVELSNIISDIISSQTPCYLYDESNTRIKYPSLPTNFDEKTIYLAFITYCKFNTTLPIPESLQLVCHEKPSKFNSDDSLEERIKQIKNNRIGLLFTRQINNLKLKFFYEITVLIILI